MPNSVRNSAPVGHTSRHAACVQCLQTLDIMSQRTSVRPSRSGWRPGRSNDGMPRNCGSTVPVAVPGSGAAGTPGSVPVSCAVCAPATADVALPDGPVGVPANAGIVVSPSGRGCSMNATCRHEFAVSPPVLSNDVPSRLNPSSGMRFHSLHATSHALHPMHTLVSVKNPMRGGAST